MDEGKNVVYAIFLGTKNVVLVILAKGLFVNIDYAEVKREENEFTLAGYPPVSVTDDL
jgi:hypothetical protein